MLSIRSWYSRNARIPLIVLIALIVAVQATYVAVVLFQNERAYSEQIENMVSSTSVALLQKNRVMLESLLNSASRNLILISFALCENEKVIVSIPPDRESCLEVKPTVFSKLDRFQIPGFAGFEILAIVPYVKLSSGLLATTAVTILISIIAIFLVGLISSRFENQILAPILEDFESEKGIQIVEFAQLKDRRIKAMKLEKQRALMDLAKQVAHDIRSPLSALKIGLAKINSKGSEAQLINSATDKIEGIAEELLNFERKRPEESFLVTREFFIDLIGLKSSELSEILFDLNYRIKEAVTISASRTDLFRSISNLINNSYEAKSDNRSIAIELIVETMESKLKIIVRDNGKGISSEVLEVINRGAASVGKNSDKSGFGLGLSYARTVAEQAGGSLALDSELSIGTLVTLTFPIVNRLVKD